MFIVFTNNTDFLNSLSEQEDNSAEDFLSNLEEQLNNGELTITDVIAILQDYAKRD